MMALGPRLGRRQAGGRPCPSDRRFAPLLQL